jgi:hypothetical protein
MIYSKKNDFLFIKGKKVAGTSVEMALSTICGPDDIISQITPIDEIARLRLGGRGAQNYSDQPEEETKYIEKLSSLATEGSAAADLPIRKNRKPIYSGHMALMDFVRAYGSLPTQRIFCVERSPYAKVISVANMRGNFQRYKREGGTMQVDLEQLKLVVEQKLRRRAIDPNIDLYRGEDGSVRTRVLRYESLEQDFAQLLTEYGISPVPNLPHAKQGANSNSIEPLDFFTRDQLNTINEIFAEEFDTFGYERL